MRFNLSFWGERDPLLFTFPEDFVFLTTHRFLYNEHVGGKKQQDFVFGVMWCRD